MQSICRHKGEGINAALVEILSIVGFHRIFGGFFSKAFIVCHHLSKYLKRGLKNSRWFGAVSEHY